MNSRFLLVVSFHPDLLPPTLELAHALTRRGIEVDLVYVDVQNSNDVFDTPFSKITRFEISNHNLLNRILYPINIKSRLTSYLISNHYNTVIACDIVSLQALAGIDNGFIKNKIYWAFELSGIEKKISLSWDAARSLLFFKYLSKIDFILAPSIERKQILLSVSRHVPVYVVPNFRAVRNNEGQTHSQKTGLTTKLVFAGRISFGSAIDLIIKEVVKYSNLTLTLVGPMDSNFKEWFDGIEKPNVNYEGKIDNTKLISFLSGFDISICTYSKTLIAIESKFPAPTKVGDGIAAGTMLLCSDQPYMKEIVEGNKLGVCFDFKDVQTAVKRISTLPSGEIDLIKSRVKQLFYEKFSMDKNLEELILQLQNE